MTARILGIGAVTSLGGSLQQTLAALDDGEMGLSRDRKAIGIDGLPMTLAPVWPLHEIHNPLERLARLATLALNDLADQGLDPAQATRFTLCLPAWVQQGRHGDLLRARLAERCEPRRVCRRLQLLSKVEHHEQDNEQVFSGSA